MSPRQVEAEKLMRDYAVEFAIHYACGATQHVINASLNRFRDAYRVWHKLGDTTDGKVPGQQA